MWIGILASSAGLERWLARQKRWVLGYFQTVGVDLLVEAPMGELSGGLCDGEVGSKEAVLSEGQSQLVYWWCSPCGRAQQ